MVNCAYVDGPRGMPETHWSEVLRAGRLGDPEAIEGLCRAYWSPVYAFFRGLGCDRESARDTTQSFFADILRRNALARVAPDPSGVRRFRNCW